MSGLLSVSVSEAQGFVAIPADLDRLAVVMGFSSAGSGFSAFFLSGASAIASVGYGDAVDTLTQIIEQRQANGGAGNKFPAALYTTPGSTAGTYGTIDNSGVTGTARFVVGATAPYGTFEARVKWIAGGTVGIAGATYQTSLDGGRTYSNTTALGTSDTILIPNSNATFVAGPGSTDLTALNTLINEEFGDFNAHVVLTTGTVHSNADNADVVSAGTYPSATSTATRIARINALKAAYNLHRVKGSGGSPAIHINVSGDTVNTLATPDATDDESALTLALSFKVALNAHDATTTVHTIADATNTVTSPAPNPGTLIAGDVVKVRTLAPQPSTTDVDNAFAALALALGDFALIVCEFPCNAAMAAHITTGLNTLLAVGKRVTALVRSRIPDAETSETDAAWNLLVAADMLAFNDDRIIDRAAYGLVTDAMTTRQYLRSTLAQFAADTVRVDRSEWPCAPADQAEANVLLSDASGTLVGHDEGPRGASTGLSDDALGNRFSTEQRMPDPLRREAVFNAVPWTLYAPTSKIKNLMTRRVANALERQAVSAGISGLGGKLFYTPADPAVAGSLPTLTDTSRNALHGVIFGALSAGFADDIQNADDGDVDTGLVQINPIVTVSGGNLLTVAVTLAPIVLGYLLKLNITLAVRE